MKRLSDTNLFDRRRFLLGVARSAAAGAVLGPAVVKAGPPGSTDCGQDRPRDLDTSVRARPVPQDWQSGHDFEAVRADGDLFKDLLLPQLDSDLWPPADLGDYKIAAPPRWSCRPTAGCTTMRVRPSTSDTSDIQRRSFLP